MGSLLDDLREPPRDQEWVVCRSTEGAIEQVRLHLQGVDLSSPRQGEMWLIRDDIGLPEERRIILITRVYNTSTGSGQYDMKFRAVDGLFDGRVMEKLGEGWLLHRLDRE